MRPAAFSVLKGLVRPPHTALVQTHGSFGSKYYLSRTAVILTTHLGNEYSLYKTYDTHNHSTESEWCSVLDGIQYAVKRGESCVELENNNLGVIWSLIKKEVPPKQYIAEYYAAIYSHVNLLEYFSLRWIPRRFNRADVLFQIRQSVYGKIKIPLMGHDPLQEVAYEVNLLYQHRGGR